LSPRAVSKSGFAPRVDDSIKRVNGGERGKKPNPPGQAYPEERFAGIGLPPSPMADPERVASRKYRKTEQSACNRR